MKRIVLLSFLLIFLSACEKGAGVSTVNTMTVTAGGLAEKALTVEAGLKNTAASRNEMYIQATFSDSQAMNISISDPKVGTFTNASGSFVAIYIMGKTFNYAYYSSSNGSSVNITAFDSRKKIIKGTFQFVGEDYNGGKIAFSGTFETKYIGI